ncbi:MAG: hypothetical protein AABZ30_03230, partial [Myxococcota bacterium]
MIACAACGGQLPGDTRFCGFCGFRVAPMGKPAPPGAHKAVTAPAPILLTRRAALKPVLLTQRKPREHTPS